MKVDRLAIGAVSITALLLILGASLIDARPVSAAATTYSSSSTTERSTCPVCTYSESTNSTSTGYTYTYSSSYSSTGSYGPGSLAIGDFGLATIAASSLLVALIVLAMRRKREVNL